jgi:hypothetical protein
VHDRAHRDRLAHRVDAGVVAGELAHEGEPLLDRLLPQVAQVEVDVGPVAPLKRPLFLDLLHHRPRQDVARAELHLLRDVVLEEPVPLPVDQVTALATRGLGHEDPAPRKAGGVVLDELHVLQRHAGPVGQ